ncbi:SIS domain-containing protein [Chloroflexota bacterium]
MQLLSDRGPATLNIRPYTQDILDQPNSIKHAMEAYPEERINSSLVKNYRLGKFDRIILTGLGASLNSLYPTYLALTFLDIPVIYLNTAELIYDAIHLLNSTTLLVIASQSGRSAEILKLLSILQQNDLPGFLVGLTNDCDSPLGLQADLPIDIHAGEEYSVATKTYSNSFSYSSLIANQILGVNIKPLINEFISTSNAMRDYLENWQSKLENLNKSLGDFEVAGIVGRGTSMAGVRNGALTLKEAARFPIEGFHAAQFRHGPLEMISSSYLLLILEGFGSSVELNKKLAIDVIERKGSVLWVGAHKNHGMSNFLFPEVSNLTLPLFEILSIQLLSLVIAKRKKIQAGEFKNIGKVVDTE